MKFPALVLACVLLAATASADRLAPDAIRHLGRFRLPPRQGPGVTGTWDWGTRGLTLIPDCLGKADPSPDDGYPGCIGGFGHDHGFLFGVFDIVPPGEQAQQVIPFYSLGGTLPNETLAGVGSIRYWDVLYDRGPSHCRIWWTYGTWFIRISDDPPFLGVSSCDPGSPNPQGMWGFGKRRMNIQNDPFHSAKMYQGLSEIPSRIADARFDGQRMMLGISRKSGTRGGSQGPSVYVRPMNVPRENPAHDLTPLLWYRLTMYVKWYDVPEMRGGAIRHWTEAHTHGIEWLSAESSEAMAVVWESPVINPDDYPCSDPTAYRDNNPKTPEPCKVPVCWYGVQKCMEGPAEFQQPSFWEDTKSGKPMPKDCNLRDGGDYTGPHCLSKRPFLLLYDIDDLAAVYRGELKHNVPQPYASIPLAKYGMHGGSVGSTYDDTRRLLYVAQGGPSPAVHIFSVAPEAGR